MEHVSFDEMTLFGLEIQVRNAYYFRIVLVLAPSLSKIQFGSLGELSALMIAAEIKLKSTIQKPKKSNKNELKITQMLTSVQPFSSKPTKTSENQFKLVGWGIGNLASWYIWPN